MSRLPVKVLTNTGPVDVDVVWSKHGLCVHRVPGDNWGWSVTHMASGKSVGWGRTMSEAITTARRVLPLAEWTLSEPVLVACPSLGADIRRIGAESTT